MRAMRAMTGAIGSEAGRLRCSGLDGGAPLDERDPYPS